MTGIQHYTLSKEERICSKLLIDKLFEGGSLSMSAFPVRAVFQFIDADKEVPAVQILVSVPKRCFKHAVKRNRVKRQIREAYRLHKHVLYNKVEQMSDKHLLIAFIWTDNKLWATDQVVKKVTNLLQRISEKTDSMILPDVPTIKTE